MIATVRAGDRGLLVAANGTDDRRAEVLRPLTHDKADSAGSGMDQDRVASLHLVCIVQQAARGHAADHHRGGGAFIDGCGQGDQARRRYDAQFGVGAFRHAGIGDAITNRKVGHAGPESIYDPSAFKPDRGG